MELKIKGITESAAATLFDFCKNIDEKLFFELTNDGKLVKTFKPWKANVPVCPGNNKWVDAAKVNSAVKPKVFDVTITMFSSRNNYDNTLSCNGFADRHIKGTLEAATNYETQLEGLLQSVKAIKAKANITIKGHGSVFDALEKGWLRKWNTNNYENNGKSVKYAETWKAISNEFVRACASKVKYINDKAVETIPEYEEMIIPDLPENITDEELDAVIASVNH